MCSIGVVIVKNSKIVEEFYRLVEPTPNYYADWATDCHGLERGDTDGARKFPEEWKEIAVKISGLPLVAHNKSFDERVLKECHKHFGIPYPNYNFYCTLQTARMVFPNLPNHQLHTVSAHIGYDLDNHHHSLSDTSTNIV